MSAFQSAPPRPGLGARRWVCIFFAFCLGGVGVILVSVAPSVAGDISQAQTLAARGVRVPLISATFTTRTQSATRAVGADSCAVSGATVRYSFNGTPRTAALREVMGADLPTCSDALDAATKLDYAPGTPLLVDPQDPSSVALMSEVAKQTASPGRADGTRAAGIVLLVLGAFAGLLALIPRRRRRTPAYAGPSGPVQFGPPGPQSQFGPPEPQRSYGPPERQSQFGPPEPRSSFGPPEQQSMYGPTRAPSPYGSPPRAQAGRKHRTVGEQLNRSPTVMHASWLSGVVVLLGGAGAGGFSVLGVIFLLIVFLPVFVAYRRDRLTLPIVFASLFLPAWPWAMYKAVSGAPRIAPATS